VPTAGAIAVSRTSWVAVSSGRSAARFLPAGRRAWCRGAGTRSPWATTTSPQAAFTPVIEPNTQQWLNQLAAASAGSPPLYELSPEDARQLLRYVQASVPVRLKPADIDDRVIPGGPTGQVSIRIIRLVGAASVLPVIFHFHGGGWILGDKDTHERFYRELANAAQAVVMFVDYTPAPDAQYPVQNEQAYTALQWAVANAAGIGVDPTRVALVGDSTARLGPRRASPG
jgi:acetyl esterase